MWKCPSLSFSVYGKIWVQCPTLYFNKYEKSKSNSLPAPIPENTDNDFILLFMSRVGYFKMKFHIPQYYLSRGPKRCFLKEYLHFD